MPRTTIDFGIDLGTTNSVIAVANEGKIEIIKNGEHQITPSMVYIDKRGRVYRGHPAAHQIINPKKSSDVQSEFKREMGQKVQRHFRAADRSMSPEELSAEILSELRRAATERLGEQPASAVITVPAMFELPQNDATARAAKLAGFQNSVLLQEPVAAATAYGFESDADRAHWLVYDLGGGTFDASIISIRDNQLSVIRHAGDNYLGGADFDREIVDRVIVPMLKDNYDLDRLSRKEIQSNYLARGRYTRIKQIAEELKKNLSRNDRDNAFYEDVFEDDSGEPVDVDLELTRSAFDDLIRPHIQKSLDITARLIEDSGLKPRDIEKILLVGGSTFVPLVQEQVASLGIEVDRSMDPMTVVSHGAAIFASSQRLPKSMITSAPVSAGSAQVDLEYEPVGKDLAPPVMGKLQIDGAIPPPGTTVTINRTTDQGWTSGDLPLDAKGVFFTNVQLRDQGQSAFQVSAHSSDGDPISCSPDSFAITYGMTVAKASLSQALSVGLANGQADQLIPAGASLPSTSEVHLVRTIKDLRRGSSDSLHIPFMSGDHAESENNLVGTLWVLNGKEIERDLPKGTSIEITVEVDRSMITSASIVIPLLDQSFDVVGDSELKHEPPEVMLERLEQLRVRLGELNETAAAKASGKISDDLAKIESANICDQIEEQIGMWEHGDPVVAGQARGQLVDLSKRIKALEGLVNWPTKLSEFEETKAEVRKLVHESGTPDERQALDELSNEAGRAITAEDPRMLEKATHRLNLLGHILRRKDPKYLAAVLHYLAEEDANYLDRRRAQALLQEGALALRRQDSEALHSIIAELFRLLPPDVSNKIGPAVRSDII